MKRTAFTVLAVMLSALTALADAYKTPGDGTTWTFSKLSEIPEAGLIHDGTVFTMTNDIEIATGDNFMIESGIKILMADNVRFTVSSDADFTATEEVLFTAAGEEDQPYGIYMANSSSVTRFRNINFEHAGVRCLGEYGIEMEKCTFTAHNGLSGTSALTLGTNGAEFRITGCTFTQCSKSAIGGAANYATPVTIEDCIFTENGTANANYPQLNLTVAENVTVRNCKIVGSPDHNMVGGLVVSNLVGFAGTLNTLIENNEIRDNRFGIAAYNRQTTVIRNNTITGNKYETNPMNGGSGINVYDPYKTQCTMITGNYIEGNLWGITVIGGQDVNIGKTEDPASPDYNPGLNVFLNNGNNGVPYDLYNNSPSTVYAQGNFWKSVPGQTRENIESVVFHKNDNPALGEVIFMPALEQEPTGIEEMQDGIGKATEIEIYSIDGTFLGKTASGNLPHIKQGQYILRMKTGQGTVIRKTTI
ncbi:MAG: right-handed parallel beta-helix repeat-containing protein [Bacteroidales bacterium]|nr:right-handed parallel beta-helix repeat-containing protein [Bacteroidales bacterium]MCM1146876.1 right-handed parallel beta-helix repeat-containing protein [Bacteroidales bacterium]MCM1205626.1 right-handed parallel beta-helix repeat-containing protein [Bacillota bacterium]MCM1510263.1 right-handed parallel beta-helix repeat-containing protein [Clostridium sp.]